jgi:bifunctional DNase/RNase
VADAIALRLQDVAVPRPQTHDLLHNVIGELGGTVKSVVVTDLKDDTFFAKILVEQDGRTVEIDSRPSDAIALAVRAEVPIFAAEDVLERAGIILEEEGQLEGDELREQPTTPTPEELEKLAPFRDFVAGLDLDDLGKAE